MKKILLTLLIFSIAFAAHAQDLNGKILFSHFNRTTQSDTIYSMDNNGTNVTVVTVGYRPRLSHDGKHLAFTNGPLPNQSYDGNLWMRDLTLEHDTLIVSNSDYLDYYDFFPDNSMLIYSEECGIFSTNIDGTNSYTPICYCGCYSDDPTIRLSDTMVVYHNVFEGIHTMEINGTNVTTVPHTIPGDLFPIWSPDGQWIVYEKTTPGLYYVTNNLCKIKPDGSDSTQLSSFAITDTLTADPVWANDMQSIYVIGRINSQLGLYRINANGTGEYTMMKSLYDGGSVIDYWLGLADSISSNPLGISQEDLNEFNFSLSPNPAKEQVTIQLTTKHASATSLEILDLAGRKITTVFEGNLQEGNHSFSVNLNSLVAGNYLVRFRNGDASIQKKLIVIR